MITAWWDAVPGEALPVTVTKYTAGVEEVKEQDVTAVLLAVRPTGVEGQVTVKPEDVTVEVRATPPAKF